MKKYIFCCVILFATQVHANINCNEQYNGGYNCYNMETGQTQTININQYPRDDIQPLPMPDISVLPDPTSMMQMDSGQANDLFNPQPIQPAYIEPSPHVVNVLQNAQQTQMQINAQTQNMYAEQARQQADFAHQQILASQQRIQANQQRLAELQAKNAENKIQNSTYSYPENVEISSNNSSNQNYIIALLLILVVVLAGLLGVFWQKNR